MRGPEEAMNSDIQSSSNQDRENKRISDRDPGSSPPCKRLKQAVLNFQPNATASSSSSSCCSSPKTSSGVDIIVIDDDRTPNCGGLVTAAPSPPEKGQHKSSTPVSSDDTCEKPKDIEMEENTTMSKPADISQNDSPKFNCQVSPIQKNINSTNIKTPVRPLTSAEKKKCKEEIQKIKEEKQKLKEEKEKQRLEAKALKEKERFEAKQKKEQEKLEKQAEKEKKEKERLEKRQKEEKEKLEKKEKKEEERRKKEEETNAKLVEKRKREEEKKQQEEEMERKKKQARISFTSFFTKTTTAPPKTLPKAVLKFEPFEIKPNMSLAPVHRTQLSKGSQQTLDKSVAEQTGLNLYVEELQKRKPLPPYKKERRRRKVSKSNEDSMEVKEMKENIDAIEISDDESSSSGSIIEIQQEEKKRMKAIFLKFYENNRPPYYGTQTKRSKKISAKNPFLKDEVLLNYEVDSDDEWEEEEPGESLSDDSDGDDDADEDADEDDDGFMVPHGYLSDDEGIDADDEENQVNSSAKQEQQLAKVKAWEAELKKKCKAKKAVCIGCVWPDYDDNDYEMLKQFEACILVDEPTIPIHASSSAMLDCGSQPMGDTMTATPDSNYNNVAMYVPEEAMPDLITLIHRSTAGVVKLINYFQQHWSKKCDSPKAHPLLVGKGQISKRQLETKIKAIATKERRNDKARWYVHSNILATYGLSQLEATNDFQRDSSY